MNKTLYKQAIKALGISLLIVAFFSASAPIYVFAATTNSDGTQSSAYSDGISKSSSNNGSYSSIATETLSCSAGKILANILSSAVSAVMGKLLDTATDVTEDVSGAALGVPTNSTVGNLKVDAVGSKVNLGNAANVGHSTIGGVVDLPSWDAVAYCIINSVITYIADSTINWANSGFNGNPSFIENTGNFFQDLADKEAGTFVSQLAKSATGGGIDLCSNFKVEIAVGLSNYYSKSNFKNTATCSLSKVVTNMENFTNGDFSDGSWNAWFSMTQNDQNNRIGATIISTDELYAKLSAKNNTAKLELGLNKGFLNYKKCDKNEDGTTDAKSCKTVTPGIVIQGELEKTLGLKKDRLVLAQKFDQVIEAVVNNLIKKGVSEILTTSSSK